MRTFITLTLAIALGGLALAAGTPSLTGTWTFKADKSTGVGMMGDVQITAVITQEGSVIKIRETSLSRGQQQVHNTTYDVSGAPKPNESPMGEASNTTSHWEDGKLVTTWTGPGAVAGTTSVQTETRSLSVDGKIMSVAWTRGGKTGVVMVYERQ